jgi:hypothetical protein
MQLATNLLNLLAMRPLETTEIAKALKVIMEGHRLESDDLLADLLADDPS